MPMRTILRKFLAALAQNAADMQHLSDDFAGGQMAHEAHLSCGAKDAAHGAAGLGADAGGGASFKGHEDGFDGLVILKMQQKFAREAVTAVGGDFTGKIPR